jgi:KaiC/GvpD/RAD55 family RecA-like ATPase
MRSLAEKYGEETLAAARKHYADALKEETEQIAARIAEGQQVIISHVGDCTCHDHAHTDGEACGFDDLRGFAVHGGAMTESASIQRWRRPWTADSCALHAYLHARNWEDPSVELFDRADVELTPDEPERHFHHWALFEDLSPHGLAPAKIASHAEQVSFAEQWRESLPREARAREVAALVVPGAQVVFAFWSAQKIDESGERAMARELNGDRREPRFRAVAYPFKFPGLAAEDWVMAEEEKTLWGIYLPAEVATATKALPRALAAARAPGAADKLVTGISALDQLAHGAPGLARGVLVVAAGIEGSGKSSLYFEIAETALAAGDVVLWAAHDEKGHRIRERQLKRRGVPPTVAEARPAAELAKLEALDFFVIGAVDLLEISWEAAYDFAAGRPLTVVVDCLQKVNMAGLDEHGQRERIDAALKAIQACQERWPATVLATSEATSSGKAKGSTGIGHAADVVLELSRQRGSDVVRVIVSKNRDGAEQTIEVVLDRVGQRVLAPGAAAKAKASVELRACILEVIDRHGVASQTKIEVECEGFDNKRVRAELKNLVAEGVLAKGPKGFTRP